MRAFVGAGASAALLAAGAGIAVALGTGASAHENHAHSAAQVLAPGYRALAYTPPAPGTYRLPPLGTAADGELVDEGGRPARLHEPGDHRLLLLSFIYTHCDDVNGCPLATFVLSRVQDRVAQAPDLRDRVRLVSVSFDPARDTPAVMAKQAATFRRAGDWRFLTARDPETLAPLLQAYGQSLLAEFGPDGRPSGVYSHILRVFLVDGERRIRNIYSAAFLHADTVLADLRTLLAEAPPAAPLPFAADHAGPGDDRRGYERPDYATRSRAVPARAGTAADLVALATTPAPGRPRLPVPADSPLTRERVVLGRKLFFDRRLSHNGTLSCAMCHVPEQGYTSNELATAVGIEGRSVRRNAPTLLDVAWAPLLFHDGRERSLELQPWGPLLAANEMGNPSIGEVVRRIAGLEDYRGAFEAAFDGRGPDVVTVGQALAAYERTLVSGASPYDRWHYGGERDALDPAARRGHALFTGKAGCVRCHAIGPDAAPFTDGGFHDTGIGWARSMGTAAPPAEVTVAPATRLRLAPGAVAASTGPVPNDLGRYEITLDPADRWKYRTPTLRNIALTAPYMHDGSLATLADVIDYYDRGGVPHEGLDPLLAPLRLAPEERAELEAFLRALTGERVGTLVSDARAAPIGDPLGGPR